MNSSYSIMPFRLLSNASIVIFRSAGVNCSSGSIVLIALRSSSTVITPFLFVSAAVKAASGLSFYLSIALSSLWIKLFFSLSLGATAYFAVAAFALDFLEFGTLALTDLSNPSSKILQN